MGSVKKRSLALLLALAAWHVRAAETDLDVNGDGVVRVAFLTAPSSKGSVDAALVCADLEGMLKSARTGKPVRVVLESSEQNRTLLGWWYNPDLAADRARLLSGGYDWLLLRESDEIIGGYPELFFEGVRAISTGAAAKGIRSAIVLAPKPVSTFRDKRTSALAETAYRTGDGCGVSVIPAGFGWVDALTHNRLTGDSPIKARASAYLAAAGICCWLTDAKLPKAALETDWTTKRTTEGLAASAYDAIRKAAVTRHYSGPFAGVVRIEPHIRKRLRIYAPGTSEEDPVRQNFQFILDAACQDWFWKTPADWYASGFDRYATVFDAVYADARQMDQYLDGENYTSTEGAATNQPTPSVCVFCRNPESAGKGPSSALKNLESVLIEGYDYAKAKGLIFVPYQVAWARAWQTNPALTEDASAGRSNDWLSYMLATMLYTAVTDRFLPVPEKSKPHVANVDHPHGYHDICARIGFDTMVQLSRMTAARNAVLLRTSNYRIDAEAPGFVALRLLDRPSADVKVFCAANVPATTSLSQESLTFTPDNFDIEQSVRVAPATNSPTLFLQFMASAQSEDRRIDGASDVRPFLLNYDENQALGFRFDRDAVSPEAGFSVSCSPQERPCDMVCVSVVQHGLVTEEVYFSQDQYAPRPVRLFPTAQDYQGGSMRVTLRVASADRRFNGRSSDFTFRVSSAGQPLPEIRVVSPVGDSAIAGPAFVTAKAQATPVETIRDCAVFLGMKRLGRAPSSQCSAAVEVGPPQSRLGPGTYTLWAAATTKRGVVIASEPTVFRVGRGSVSVTSE